MVITLSQSPRSADAAFAAASRAFVMALALASLSLDLTAQKEVGYPDWVKSIVPSEPHVPAEYRGRHAIEIGEQFAVGPHRITARPFFVSHTTTSGVIAIVDSSSSEKVKKGWDTGFARVHSATRLPSTASHPLRLLCTVRDDSVSRCRVVEVRVTPRGDLSQRLIGPPSATDGALWTMATMIDGAVYLFDATSSSIIRIIDTSGDGAPDTIDPGFTVVFPASPDDPVRRHGLPIRRFVRISPDLINLHADPDGGVVDLRLDPGVTFAELLLVAGTHRRDRSASRSSSDRRASPCRAVRASSSGWSRRAMRS
ncbi:MAG: hypothetical protein R3F20_02815 [Planctomycetota bacterium]